MLAVFLNLLSHKLVWGLRWRVTLSIWLYLSETKCKVLFIQFFISIFLNLLHWKYSHIPFHFFSRQLNNGSFVGYKLNHYCWQNYPMCLPCSVKQIEKEAPLMNWFPSKWMCYLIWSWSNYWEERMKMNDICQLFLSFKLKSEEQELCLI